MRLRELFNQWVHSGDLEPRLLDEMLLLADEDRQACSFLCSGEHVHGPLALAVVDGEVLLLDFDHAPPDRWHMGVNMCSDMLDALRTDLIKPQNSVAAAVCNMLWGRDNAMRPGHY